MVKVESDTKDKQEEDLALTAVEKKKPILKLSRWKRKLKNKLGKLFWPAVIVFLVCVAVLIYCLVRLIWFAPPEVPSLTGPTMQSFTDEDCRNFPTPTGTDFMTVGDLIDERDGQVYQVRKFADGKCWMVDNLAYDLGDVGAYPHDCYGEKSRCGYLYTYDAIQKEEVCPVGWSLPTYDEFRLLYYGAYYGASLPNSFWQPNGAWKGIYSYRDHSLYNDLIYYWTADGRSVKNKDLARYFLDESSDDNMDSLLAIRCVKNIDSPEIKEELEQLSAKAREAWQKQKLELELKEQERAEQERIVEEERENQSLIENGVEFDGYIFSYSYNYNHNYNDGVAKVAKVAKIPLGKKITTANAEWVMDFSVGYGGYDDGVQFFSDPDYLYINFYEFYQQGMLYRLASATAVPELVMQAEDNDSPYLKIIDSPLQPSKLKFLDYASGDGCGFSGKIYYYLPASNYSQLLFEYGGGCSGKSRFYGISSNDVLLVGEWDEEKSSESKDLYYFESALPTFIKQINGVTVDPDARTTNVIPVIAADKMSEISKNNRYEIIFDESRDQLYVIAREIYVYDLKTKTLEMKYDLANLLPLLETDDFDRVLENGSFYLSETDKLCLAYYARSSRSDFMINLETGRANEAKSECSRKAN